MRFLRRGVKYAPEEGQAQGAPAGAARQGMHLPVAAVAAAPQRQRACDLFPDRGLVVFPDRVARPPAVGLSTHRSSYTRSQYTHNTYKTADSVLTFCTAQPDTNTHFTTPYKRHQRQRCAHIPSYRRALFVPSQTARRVRRAYASWRRGRPSVSDPREPPV